MWSMTLNASEVMNGSVQPSRYGTRMRWPELEIGRNSVSPWTIPMIGGLDDGVHGSTPWSDGQPPPRRDDG